MEQKKIGEIKKTSEELADEALDAVAGGRAMIVQDVGPWECDICGAIIGEGCYRWWDGVRICKTHKMSS